jgi:hypothetical protein
MFDGPSAEPALIFRHGSDAALLKYLPQCRIYTPSPRRRVGFPAQGSRLLSPRCGGLGSAVSVSRRSIFADPGGERMMKNAVWIAAILVSFVAGLVAVPVSKLASREPFGVHRCLSRAKVCIGMSSDALTETAVGYLAAVSCDPDSPTFDTESSTLLRKGCGQSYSARFVKDDLLQETVVVVKGGKISGLRVEGVATILGLWRARPCADPSKGDCGA